MIVTGVFIKHNGNFRMHGITFPYNSKTYVGYSLNQMKQQYRTDFGLKGKHIEWIILGLND